MFGLIFTEKLKKKKNEMSSAAHVIKALRVNRGANGGFICTKKIVVIAETFNTLHCQ